MKQKHIKRLQKNLPDSLKQTGYFCLWKYEKDKNDRLTKVPYNARTKGHAESNNIKTFAPFKTAIKEAEAPEYDGLGIGVFDDLTAIDIDHCIDDDGTISDMAQDIIDTMDSYTEISPSGTGIRILFKDPGLTYDDKTYYIKNSNNGLEIYVSGMTKRFVTVTGNVIRDKDIETRVAVLPPILDKYMKRPTPPTAENTPKGPVTPSDIDDAELIEKACNSSSKFARLWNGDVSDYSPDGSSQSEADEALCCMLVWWTQRDPIRVDSLFRQSGLMRPKWDELRGRDTYGNITIEKAMARVSGSYDPSYNSGSSDFLNYDDIIMDPDDVPDIPTPTDDDAPPETKTTLPDVPKTDADLLAEHNTISGSERLVSFWETIKNSVNETYISTGFYNLDDVLDGGLYNGLYILGAISSLGKTTFMLQMADYIAARGRDVLYFSLEMAADELISKSISRLTYQFAGEYRANAKTARGISTGSRYSHYNAQEKDLITRASNRYKEIASHIYLYEGIGDIGVDEIKTEVMEHVRLTGNTPVVFIDYLQILAPYDLRASDKQNTDKAVLELKRLSRDLKLPVVAISSFNRDSYDREVDLTAFKESGAIEYGSDVLFALQPQGMTAGINQKEIKKNRKLVRDCKKSEARNVEVIILKNRHGKAYTKAYFTYKSLFNCFEPCKEAAVKDTRDFDDDDEVGVDSVSDITI